MPHQHKAGDQIQITRSGLKGYKNRFKAGVRGVILRQDGYDESDKQYDTPKSRMYRVELEDGHQALVDETEFDVQ